MSTIADVEKLLMHTRTSLNIPIRNAYEAENLYLASVERLKEAREKLSNFSGDYVKRLLHELDKMEVEVNKMVSARLNHEDTLFDMDFDTEEAENEVDEVAAAERMLEKKQDVRKKQNSRKAKAKKTSARASSTEKRETFSSCSGNAPQQETKEDAPVVCTDDVRFVDVAKCTECHSSEIPQEAIGPGRCVLISGTPLARLDFTNVVNYDGILCQCRVTLHRVVVTALTYGVPLSKDNVEAIGAENLPLVVSESEKTCFGGVLQSDGNNDAEKMAITENEESEIAVKEEEFEDETLSVESQDSVTAELSKELVAKYDAMLAEKEEQESCTKFFPTDVPSTLSGLLRGFSSLPWVILMCHGGYFAGGVFVDGKPVVHKSFQRYVVRKKQGGKQSSNEKDGGSYNSIGSQIRRAQEIKWKLNVRDILLSWRHYINAAAVILYVAPGPQNRAVLTDFSRISSTLIGTDKHAQSPVSLRDPRVHRAPLTTHRPTFQEVKRIYDVVSVCTIEYVQVIT